MVQAAARGNTGTISSSLNRGRNSTHSDNMSSLRVAALGVAFAVLSGHADAAGCGVANIDGSVYAISLHNTATTALTLTLDKLLANQLLTTGSMTTATSTATNTMIVLGRDANITLLFAKDTIPAAHRPRSAFIDLAWPGGGSSDANILLSDPITHRQKFGEHLEVSGFVTSQGDVCIDGWLTKVSTPSDRSGDGDDDYVPNPNSIQAGTGTCISRVGAACGTAACCGGLACTAELCKLDSDAYVPARVDNRDRENTTDFERSSWVAAAETDNTGIVVGAILACLSMVGFVLLVVKMRRDTRDVDVNFDTQSYDPRPSRANKFGRWATFDTNDNDGVSYNYETESDGGNSKFGARGRSITNATSNNYTRNHTHASIPSLAMPTRTDHSDVSTVMMEGGIYVPDLKSQSHRYVKLGKGKGGQNRRNSKIAGPAQSISAGALSDETDTTTASSQYA